MRRVSTALGVLALLTLAACSSGSGKKATATTTTEPPTSTTLLILHAPTKLTINGYSPGVNQGPFYSTATVTKVTCPAGSVVFTVPPGGPGTAAGTAMTAATTVVVTPGKAQLRDSAGKVLYSETSKTLTISDHGSFVLAMVNAAATDSQGRRVAAGSVDIAGDYLCP